MKNIHVLPTDKPNIIDNWLEKNGDPEIDKQVEQEAVELFANQSTKDRILSETSEETKQKAIDYAKSLITKSNMTSERIKQIQQGTAYPESRSVHQALLQVCNECEQDKNKYSEEEVIDFTNYVLFGKITEFEKNPIKTFEKFKNK
jgi:uncharacterized protein with PIN domain